MGGGGLGFRVGGFGAGAQGISWSALGSPAFRPLFTEFDFVAAPRRYSQQVGLILPHDSAASFFLSGRGVRV